MSYQIKSASLMRRAIAFVIDCIGLIVILMLLLLISRDMPNSVATAVMFCYFLFKDVVGGRSLGKRIVKISVHNASDYRLKPNIVQLIIRNFVLLLLHGIELFVVLFTPNHRRIGDYVTGTVVVEYSFSEQVTTRAHLPKAERHSARPRESTDAQQIDVDLSKWDVLDKDLQFDSPVDATDHDHITIAKKRKVDYTRDYIKENDWE